MTKLPKNKVSVSVSIPIDFLSEIDETAYSLGQSRSEFIVNSLKKEVREIKNSNK